MVALFARSSREENQIEHFRGKDKGKAGTRKRDNSRLEIKKIKDTEYLVRDIEVHR